MKLEFLIFFTLFNSACSSFTAGGFLTAFKGAGSLQAAIDSRNTVSVTDIMKWKKCHLLLESNNNLLRQLYLNFNPNFVDNLIVKYCKSPEFFDRAINSALLHDDDFVLESLLALFGEILDFSNIWGYVNFFESCMNSRNYKCIEIMTDWKIELETLYGKNILHFAAEQDNPILFRLAPLNMRLMSKDDYWGNFPSNCVASKKMAQAFNDRWEIEVQMTYPKWSEVKAHHMMTRTFGIPDKTLKFRVAHAARVLKHDLALRPFRLTVNRETALADTFRAVSAAPSSWYKSDLNVIVNFEGEFSIDAGGPRIEWLNILIDSIFNNNNNNESGSVHDFSAPLFKIIDEDSMMYAPTNLYNESVYKFVGSIIALAFRDQISLGVKLIPAISKQFTSRSLEFSREELAQQHPQICRGLEILSHQSPEIIKEADLKFDSEDDSSTSVTKDNIEKYIKHIARLKLLFNYEPAVNALVSGFKVISQKAKISSIFNPNEMLTILKGGDFSLSPEEFLRNCLYEVPDQVSRIDADKVKIIFEEVIRSITPDELRNLFRFITGRDSLPFNGMDGLEKKIIVRINFLTENSYPVAATCFSHLKLPKNIKSAGELKEKLLFSIKYSDRFTTE